MCVEVPGLSQRRKEVSLRKNACHGKELLEALMGETGRGVYFKLHFTYSVGHPWDLRDDRTRIIAAQVIRTPTDT